MLNIFSSCIQDYNLKPNVKKFAIATLVSLSLSFIIQIIYFIAVLMVAGAEASSTGTVSQETAEGAWAGAVAVYVLNAIFIVMAIIFSGIFTWGRGCCASATPPS